MPHKMKILTIAVQLVFGTLGVCALVRELYQGPSILVVIISLATIALGFTAGIRGILHRK